MLVCYGQGLRHPTNESSQKIPDKNSVHLIAGGENYKNITIKSKMLPVFQHPLN